MGFRNPITTLSASQITPGTLPSGVLLPAGQVSPGTLALQVIAQSIAPDAVTADALAAGAVLAAAIGAGAVTPPALAAAAVTAEKLAGGAVTGPKIAAGAVTATSIAAAAVVAGKIAAGTVVAADVAAGAITASKLALGVLGTNLVPNACFEDTGEAFPTQGDHHPPIPGWEAWDQPGGSYSALRYAEAAYPAARGSGCMMTTTTSTGTRGALAISNPFPMRAGATYRVGVSVAPDAYSVGSTVECVLHYYDAAGAWISGTGVVGATLAAGYVKFTATGVAPAGTVTARLGFQALNGPTAAIHSALWDDAYCIEIGSPAVEMTAAGIRMWDSAGAETISLHGDGGKITGAILQTAAEGNRVDIRDDTGGSIKFYAGIAEEVPARIIATGSGGADGDQILTIAAGTNAVTEPAIGPPSISLFCAEEMVVPFAWKGRVAVWADEFWFRNWRIDPPDLAGTVLVKRITTNQAIAATTFTGVQWNARTEKTQMNAYGDTALVALEDGLHSVDTTVIFQNAGAGATETRAVRFAVTRPGGTTYHRGYSGPANTAGNFTEVNAHLDVRLAAWDYVEIQVWATIALAVMADQGTRASMKWSSR